MNWKAVRCTIYCLLVLVVVGFLGVKRFAPEYHSADRHEEFWHLVLFTGAVFYLWDHYGCRWWSRRKKKEVVT